MKALIREKQRAIDLRKRGYSYNEILIKVPVAKSSLSLWLKDLPLTKNEKLILKKRVNSNISRGRIKAASAHHQNRLDRDKKVFEEAKLEFEKYKADNLFHSGIALYWAEGAKRSNMFQFTNSDYKMIEVVLHWLEKFASCSRHNIGYRLYIHKPYAHENLELWWQEQLSVRNVRFKKTVYKPTQLGVKKRPNYKGCLRLEVPKSTNLLRKMKYWINLEFEYCKNQ